VVQTGAPSWTRWAGTATWLGIIILFTFDEILGHVLKFTFFCIVPRADDGLSDWFSALDFATNIASCFALQVLLNALRRRQTLLWLLNGDLAVASGLSLLLCGVAASVRMQHLLSFLTQISPPPKLCCLVLFLRKYGIFIAHGIAVMYIILFMLASHQPNFWSLVFTVGLGGAAGATITVLIVTDWWARRETFLSDGRVIVLFPGTSRASQKKAMATMKQMMVVLSYQQAQGHVAGETTTSFLKNALAYFGRVGLAPQEVKERVLPVGPALTG